jgi:transposase InsO family protein
LIVRVQKLFRKELAAENDYLRAENKVLRAKFGKRVPLTEHDRRVLVKYGMRIKGRLGEVISVVRPETLDRMILSGEGHLQHVVKQIERHHNAQRPHQGLGNVIPMGFEYPDEFAPPDGVACEPILGGLLNHYHAAQAA